MPTGDDDREATLRAFVEAGRAAWPGIDVEPAAFVEYLAARSSEGLAPIELAGDLYLACACAAGMPAAIDAFQRTVRPYVERAVARVDRSPAFVDEVMQILNVRLFVRQGDRAPSIHDYSGLASLRGWVLTAAKRAALNLRRAKKDKPHAEISSGIKQLGATASPELAMLKARFKSEFESSIRAALKALDDKARSILLLHFVNGLTLNQLAATQNVSRATVARWLAAAREELFEATKKELSQRLRLSPSEYESILALVRSQLELSVVEVVRADEAL
jgi:RNA polymerase sigma-70 factor (ECF subfamily)